MSVAEDGPVLAGGVLVDGLPELVVLAPGRQEQEVAFAAAVVDDEAEVCGGLLGEDGGPGSLGGGRGEGGAVGGPSRTT